MTTSHEDTGRHEELIRQVLAESQAVQQQAIAAARAEERACIEKAEEYRRLQALKEQEIALAKDKIAAEQAMRDEYALFIKEERQTHRIIEELMRMLHELLSENRSVLSRMTGEGGMDEKLSYAGSELVYLNGATRYVLHDVALIMTFLRMQLTHLDAIMAGMKVQLSEEDRAVRDRLFATLDKAVSGKITIANSAIGGVEAGTANFVEGEQRYADR